MGMFDGVTNAISSVSNGINNVGSQAGNFLHDHQGAILGTGIGGLGWGTLLGNAIDQRGKQAMPGAPGGAYDPNSGTPPALSPYSSLTGANGQLQSQFQYNPGKIGDSSSWQNAAMGMNNAQTQNLVDTAQTGAMTQGTQAQDQLAMNGGLSSGARERIASDAGRNAMFAGQDARNTGNMNNLNIGLQGQQMNMDADKFNVGNQNQAGQFNVQNTIGNNQGQNQYNLTNYQEQMKNFTGQQLANAMGAANAQGNQGGWGNMFNNVPIVGDVWKGVFGG